MYTYIHTQNRLGQSQFPGLSHWKVFIIMHTYIHTHTQNRLGQSPFPGLSHWKDFVIALCAPWYLIGTTFAICAEKEGGKLVKIWQISRQPEVSMHDFYVLRVCVCVWPKRKGSRSGSLLSRQPKVRVNNFFALHIDFR
jgi:hypothetical protein